MIVWVLALEYSTGSYESYCQHEEVVGVYSTWAKAQEAAGSSKIAMGAKDGISWKRDKAEFTGEVKTCSKGHYYMFCKCKLLDSYTYCITSHYVDDVVSEEVPAELESA